jgi:hypothetical protein
MSFQVDLLEVVRAREEVDLVSILIPIILFNLISGISASSPFRGLQDNLSFSNLIQKRVWYQVLFSRLFNFIPSVNVTDSFSNVYSICVV